jgi:hypothetical protein
LFSEVRVCQGATAALRLPPGGRTGTGLGRGVEVGDLVKLPVVRLPGALDLHLTYLTRANLRKADLTEANLTAVDLRKADLSGANLSGANLTTTGDENIQLPPDLKPPAHWNVKTDEQIEEN